jgi:D-sedoheptulose 7-phosphate isomerase
MFERSDRQMTDLASRIIKEHRDAIDNLCETEASRMADIAAVLARAIGKDQTVWLCGNGGSAADAEHVMAEFVGRFISPEGAWRAVSLTSNAATLTSLANDFGYEKVFARQLEAMARPGDVLVAISTSGESANVLAAVATARDLGLEVVAVVGIGGGSLAAAADHVFAAPSSNTQRIQEVHILFWHVICELLLKLTRASGD